MKELELALEYACDDIYELTGSCPLDVFDYKLDKCDYKCDNDAGKCWQMYFINIAKEKGKQK